MELRARHQKNRTPGAAKMWLLLVSALIAALILSACGDSATESAEPLQKDEYLLDTICSVSIYTIENEKGETLSAADAEDEANAAIGGAFDVCRELESRLSRTREDSDISRINAAGGEWTEVDSDTAELIRKGIEYSKLSDGDFDISIGGVTGLWDFHASEADQKLPDENELEEAASHVDYNKIEIDGSRVRLADPAAEIDLGAIAKGYIGDMMCDALEDAGVRSGIINLGGNVICIGAKSDTDDFVIGIETPFSDRTEITAKVNAADETLVTSGIYERKIEVDAKIYHHILSAETGYPVDSDLSSVTLIAPKGRSAEIDALSTICLIKGYEEGLELIDQLPDIEAVFILEDGSAHATEGLRASGKYRSAGEK